MKAKTHEALLAGWHENVTCEAIATLHGLTTRAVRRFWQTAQDVGQLPPTVRPYFAARCRRVERRAGAPAVDAVIAEAALDDAALDDAALAEAAVEDDFDEEIEAPDVLTSANAGLLDRMRAHHPNLDNAAAQTVPAAWLRFDLKGARMPAPAELMAMARAYDARPRSE